jgi:hypothetical protein
MEYQAENKKMLDVYHRSKEQRYAFDKIFREESQEEVVDSSRFDRSMTTPAST